MAAMATLELRRRADRRSDRKRASNGRSLCVQHRWPRAPPLDDQHDNAADDECSGEDRWARVEDTLDELREERSRQ